MCKRPQPTEAQVQRAIPETEAGIQARIVERLAYAGYVVEITSERHHRAGRGRGTGVGTRGIGDLLVWRTSWGNGLKVNADVKKPGGRLSHEQRVSLLDGGLLIWHDEDEALTDMEDADVLMARATGRDLRVLRGTAGRVGHREGVKCSGH